MLPNPEVLHVTYAHICSPRHACFDGGYGPEDLGILTLYSRVNRQRSSTGASAVQKRPSARTGAL